MAHVYGGSGLNIAATGASDGRDGLFFDRDVELVRRCLVLANNRRFWDGMWQEPANKKVAEEDITLKLLHCINGRLYYMSFDNQPLIRRAWVFQERILAARTLHFGKTQMMWECQTNIFFETLPEGLPSNESVVVHAENWVTARSLGFQRSWASVVRSYSKCLLTQGSDRLLAISGMFSPPPSFNQSPCSLGETCAAFQE